MDLTQMSYPSQVAIVGVGVFFFFLSYGVLQEMMFSKAKFPYKGFAVTVQMTLYFSASSFHRYFTRDPSKGATNSFFSRKGSWHWYGALAVVLLLGRVLGSLSLGHMDYTIKVMLDSSRVIPVMATAYLISGKTFTLSQYAASALLATGLSGFSLAHRSSPNSFVSSYGVFLGCSMVFAMSFKSNIQEKLMKVEGAASLEVSQYGNLTGAMLMAGLSFATGELLNGAILCMEKPELLAQLMLAYSVGYCGSYSSLCFIRLTNALTGSICTAVRNMLQIVLSFALFGKTFSMGHAISAAVFFAGVAVHIAEKNRLRKQSKTNKAV